MKSVYTAGKMNDYLIISKVWDLEMQMKLCGKVSPARARSTQYVKTSMIYLLPNVIWKNLQ